MAENTEANATPVYQTYDTSPMSVGDWVITMILLAIPIVGLVMLIYWIVSSTGNVNRRNYCLATVIIAAIILVIGIIIAIFFGGMAAIMSHHGVQM
jgi:uncharacterized BrkB/YihY/UPF0761 family membrane protein